jgi:hypothetical protein
MGHGGLPSFHSSILPPFQFSEHRQAPFLFSSYKPKAGFCNGPLHRFISLIDFYVNGGVAGSICDGQELIQKV